MNFTIYIQTPKKYISVTATNCGIQLYYIKLRLYIIEGNDFEQVKIRNFISALQHKIIVLTDFVD
jgi:hypothetical protein